MMQPFRVIAAFAFRVESRGLLACPRRFMAHSSDDEVIMAPVAMPDARLPAAQRRRARHLPSSGSFVALVCETESVTGGSGDAREYTFPPCA